jgi:hypothetical protein
MKADKAAERLQALWNIVNPAEPRTVKKIVGAPKSKGSVGWTWAAIAPDGSWIDLGYTEETAERFIRHWNTPMQVAARNLEAATQRLIAIIGSRL